jgi:hypothetical protein
MAWENYIFWLVKNIFAKHIFSEQPKREKLRVPVCGEQMRCNHLWHVAFPLYF